MATVSQQLNEIRWTLDTTVGEAVHKIHCVRQGLDDGQLSLEDAARLLLEAEEKLDTIAM